MSESQKCPTCGAELPPDGQRVPCGLRFTEAERLAFGNAVLLERIAPLRATPRP